MADLNGEEYVPRMFARWDTGDLVEVRYPKALEQPSNMVTVPADKLEKMQKELKQLRKKVQEVKDKETDRSWGVFS